MTTDQIINFDGKIPKEVVLKDKKGVEQMNLIQQLDDEEYEPLFKQTKASNQRLFSIRKPQPVEWRFEALMQNYEKMASLAAENKAVVIRGTHRVHFEDQVLSWHHINGQDGEEILPAILITNRHPARFKECLERNEDPVEKDLKMIFIPLKRVCSTTTEVITLIEKIFNDIKNQKDLDDFRIARELKKGIGRALADAVILEPNFAGMGFSFKKMIEYFKNK